MKKVIIAIVLFSIALLLFTGCSLLSNKDMPVKVLMQTNKGDIVLELYPSAAPVTVKNFLNYVNQGFYDGLVFHRVIDNFMIQGGGYDLDYKLRKNTRKPIINEADNRLENLIGTISMARSSKPNSATSQFFINVKDNNFLDYRDEDVNGYGYCVFGKVIVGFEVLDLIKSVNTHINPKTGLNDWPVDDVVIKSVTII